MSIKRTNWSALSSLARQWTVEDEEEVQRERRRRVKSSTSTADPDADLSTTGRDTSSSDNASGANNTREESQSLSSEEQMQQDFMETLKVRDERRRMRHMETLRRQKEVESDGDPRRGGGRVEDEEQDSVFQTQPTMKTSSFSSNVPSSTSRMSNTDKHHENGESLSKDPHPKQPSHSDRKFVSSVSISLDMSPSVSGRTTPVSLCSPQEDWPSPCHNPSAWGPQSPVHNGHIGETTTNGVSSKESFEPTAKPAFVRHSSRTASFRLMKKKEEESAPLQRSCSVRNASKKFEDRTEQNEDKASSFQRHSRHRISSRSIQEKMEKLAQAAQKAEMSRSPDVAHRTLLLQDEVSRKRGIFEKESPQSPPSPGLTAQEHRSFTSGISQRISRWVNKSGSSHSPTSLRHVDINSKRSLFENREDSSSKSSSRNMFK
ncbi:ladinin-1 [Gouania willdenowi]|uniref:ladinin-1 n=1 Tax=Gouania willdenowi TaxID=441366 RepID=UPI0010543300|nr:ladinin-1 [Gouania willdenowi]